MKNILMLLILSGLVGCMGGDSKKTFTFAVSGEFKPFSFMTKDGKLDGFDVELGKEIAKRLGKEAKPVKYKFAGMIEGIKSGRFDAAVSSHTITPEREKFVNFSIPYYYSGPQVFSRAEKAEIKLENQEIAVSKGSTYQDIAKNFTKEIRVYDSDLVALKALEKGRHDSVITDLVVGAKAIEKGFKVYPNQVLGLSEQAVALAKDNKELLDKINKVISDMRKDGYLTQLSMKYFNYDISSKHK